MGSVDADASPQKGLRLVVGLGNPGRAYETTRHNVGFMVIDRVAGDFSISLDRRKFDVVFGRGRVEHRDVILAKPLAYMNRSGPPIRQLADYLRLTGADLLIVHDDIDLAFGRLKIKEKGGHGGHNGLKSLMAAFGGGDFVRLRVGIGRSEYGANVTDHVLGRFLSDERNVLHQILTKARDAVVTILCKGAKEGMNHFNLKKFEMTRET
jgi:peptidyl-tRNA hydrolase, PTH1 family